ncbi:hypothetical protein ASG54_08140 [Aureimonas sp. Leaf460]|nr:hypothetical protein ASG62_14290 [Aureimonas sp. Leaf427]KQT80518.1 hypothetical protein ASG54_08140 [Aureimonas sp. Leaf460]
MAQAAADILRDCRIGSDQRANCLRIAAAVDIRRGKMDEARESMRQLMAMEPGFTLEKEAGPSATERCPSWIATSPISARDALPDRLR